MSASAAGIVIGNEVLSAKVVDENGPLLVQSLKAHGVRLASLQVVPDEVDAIVEAMGLARRRARYIFTSGGIGPTHDDVTVRAVALALGRRVVLLPEMVAVVKAAFKGKEPPQEALRMAEAPEGATLLHGDGLRYPLLACGDVFMLPGVPELFKLQLQVALGQLPRGHVELGELLLNASEAEVAGVLDRVAHDAPQVQIGSYPTFNPNAGYRVRITVEHAQPGPVAQVIERLCRELPDGVVVRRTP